MQDCEAGTLCLGPSLCVVHATVRMGATEVQRTSQGLPLCFSEG